MSPETNHIGSDSADKIRLPFDTAFLQILHTAINRETDRGTRSQTKDVPNQTQNHMKTEGKKG